MTGLADYLDQYIVGNSRDLAEALPDESIDLIFTDPVYDRMEDYAWLAQLGARLLKPNASLLAWYQISLLPGTVAAMTGHGLDFVWNITEFRLWTGLGIYHQIVCKKSDMLWFSKGTPTPRPKFWDVQVSKPNMNRAETGSHKWSKGPATLFRMIESLTEPGDVVLDTFAGSGSVAAVCKILQRHCISFEIDPDTASIARERIAQTAAPLPMTHYSQPELIT